jgi:hypothetical protein
MRTGTVISLLLFLLSACRHGVPPRASTASSTPRSAPRTQEECMACRGKWGTHGLAQVPSCLCRTTDAGKRCHRRSDCQGLCLAEENVEREIVEAGPPAKGYFVGHCAEFDPIFGCMRVLDQAKPGPLDEPPAMLCID